MIIINEENDHKYNFYDRIVKTQNNLFLCNKEIKKVNESDNNIVHYNLDKKIIKNKIKKINVIITKINHNINKFNNIKYYKDYFKEKQQIKIIFNKRYKKIENITKKILYGGKQNKLLNKANERRIKHNKSII
jgi:hypothetical protein